MLNVRKGGIEMRQKKLFTAGLLSGAALFLNGCSWMGGSAMAGAIGHMVFGAAAALAGMFVYGKLKK